MWARASREIPAAIRAFRTTSPNAAAETASNVVAPLGRPLVGLAGERTGIGLSVRQSSFSGHVLKNPASPVQAFSAESGPG